MDNLLLCRIFEALVFASYKHRKQRRKGAFEIPYINHPIEVTAILSKISKNFDENMLIASILHDTIEDTKTTYPEILEKFGKNVADIVIEVTDDMSLPYNERKKLQIEKAHHLSIEAKVIKLADKICNIHDILHTRINWSRQRKIRYIKWAKQFVDEIRNTNQFLEGEFDNIIIEAESILKKKF